MFRTLQQLLPIGRAWRITVDKNLRRLSEGIASALNNVVTYLDLVYAEIWPQSTNSLELWEQQFDLWASGLTEQERRDRLDAEWKSTGGQAPRYLEDTLRAHGFDVYVHEWWEPGSEPGVGEDGCAIPRNPLLVLRRGQSGGLFLLVTCGREDATCGNAAATCGATTEPLGYPLVNRLVSSEQIYGTRCGESDITCGNQAATCGAIVGIEEREVEYNVPIDPEKWPYILYVGGETYPDQAYVPESRKNEFERLLLKIGPAHLWWGVLVTYE